MTVAELIAKLQEYPPDTEVCRWNYDNWKSYPDEIYDVTWEEIDIHPVVNGLITHTTTKVLTLK